MTQPAASAALRRLRDYFRDDIVVAVGKQMHPTPFAGMLLPEIQRSLRGVERAIATPAKFDPATSSRRFTIGTSDYIMVAVLVPLAQRLSMTAPNIELEMVLPNEESVPDLERGKIDLLITPEPYLAAWHPSELLFEEEQVVVGWAKNPVFKRGVTEEDFFAAGHVTVAMGSARTPTFADSHMRHISRSRSVEIAVASFASAPWFLIGTTRLAVLHKRLAKAMAPMFDIAWSPIPFEFPRLREMIQFHEARAHDAGLTWLRQEIMDVARMS